MKKISKFSQYENCILCPRNCGVNRSTGVTGFCRAGSEVTLARAALHFWEEPCISGVNGSGAVFFSGCNLRCIFCQNHDIARNQIGKAVTAARLTEIFLELEEKGASNINLVTATHFLPHVIYAVEAARNQGLSIPVVYNCGGYEKVDSLKALEGIIDIYLPDFKYMNPDLAAAYSHARDYPAIAKAAIAEMVRQQPKVCLSEDGLMKKGVMVRQLLLPGELYDARQILKYLFQTYGNQIYYSLLSQYTPLPQVADHPKLCRRVSPEAYETYIAYAASLGIENGFTQEREVATESFIPHFDYEGVEKY